mmetsp:Transcript_1690/g.2889  ORF Transcript_1690/g.2889 Transcript_1690/m.2889 type:complete len:247 (-) Transcript_1690:112-852(-)|eukprot:CAMPEP_0197445464 /NCGR_PEP_ID=MMETSP1175-20131217/10677_1 /TAXON_ID=1003142 /ORGANISM="Triceratium dubium, Strain CCMP147" /LENGTH=246 /DNA_ID=CAMNT_0042976425 /DNA_START=59 /DNA_END=799 /DNA_ORIENTATION=-
MAAPTAPSHEEVLALLEDSAYNPAIVNQLEAYAKSQVETLYLSSGGKAAYFFDANRTLAKLYQFFPHLADNSNYALILLLALLEFPSTDFSALGYLVPERMQEIEPAVTLVRCSDLLEQCQFAEFWNTFRPLVLSEEAPELLKSAVASPSAVNKLRRSILGLLALTYRAAPMSVVLPALDMRETSELSKFVSDDPDVKAIVEKVDGESVTFFATASNTKRDKVFKEGVSFVSVSTMINKGASLREQ